MNVICSLFLPAETLKVLLQKTFETAFPGKIPEKATTVTLPYSFHVSGGK